MRAGAIDRLDGDRTIYRGCPLHDLGSSARPSDLVEPSSDVGLVAFLLSVYEPVTGIRLGETSERPADPNSNLVEGSGRITAKIFSAGCIICIYTGSPTHFPPLPKQVALVGGEPPGHCHSLPCGGRGA